MEVAAETFLRVACESRDPERRAYAWLRYEQEKWYQAVHEGRLRVCDLEPRLQEVVFKLLQDRQPAIPKYQASTALAIPERT